MTQFLKSIAPGVAVTLASALIVATWIALTNGGVLINLLGGVSKKDHDLLAQTVDQLSRSSVKYDEKINLQYGGNPVRALQGYQGPNNIVKVEDPHPERPEQQWTVKRTW